jgi:hypothetical membrane protein
MTGIKKYIAIALIGLNAMVLLGQIYPEGAPPFARIVNIVFLVGSLVFLLFLVIRKGK